MEETNQNLITKPPLHKNVATKKRKLDAVGFRNSTFSKLRAVVKDLRPCFAEVIHAPDFRDSKVIQDIQKKMKLMLELSKQLRTETSFHPKKQPERETERQDVAVGSGLGTSSRKPSQSGEPPKVSEIASKTSKVPSASITTVRNSIIQFILEAKDIEQHVQETKATYIVGGSPIGWNFIVYPNGDPVYYGVSKETWLSNLPCKSNSKITN